MANITISNIMLPKEVEFTELSDLLERVIGLFHHQISVQKFRVF
jgi:hypothetical protein